MRGIESKVTICNLSEFVAVLGKSCSYENGRLYFHLKSSPLHAAYVRLRVFRCYLKFGRFSLSCVIKGRKLQELNIEDNFVMLL